MKFMAHERDAVLRKIIQCPREPGVVERVERDIDSELQRGSAKNRVRNPAARPRASKAAAARVAASAASESAHSSAQTSESARARAIEFMRRPLCHADAP